ncbi:hypothetical protein HYDPIDRAFT_108705 [Hydnomerulius pinastri MD-312]|nr:hypothetical protein HYDPIDRAFT_108705 [Hydnomerulius pinastri MD-312]
MLLPGRAIWAARHTARKQLVSGRRSGSGNSKSRKRRPCGLSARQKKIIRTQGSPLRSKKRGQLIQLAPPPPPSDDSDDEADGAEKATSAKAQVPPADIALDQEWIQFQQTVINAPDEREAYDRATVFAEPELASDVPEGFPAQVDEMQDEPEAKLDEEGERRKKEQEERELIMDRLMDEERAQEEADMKVTVMKNRLEALRRKREASRSTKPKPPAS